MFTNSFDKEDSITESSLFYAIFPVFHDPTFRRYRWPPVIFSIPPSSFRPPLFHQSQIHPGQQFFNLFT